MTMSTPIILTLLAAFTFRLAVGWSSTPFRSPSLRPHCPSTTVLSVQSGGENDVSVSSDDFMASLRSRMDEVNDRETKLPIVVLDAMLPRQVFRIESNEPLFINLIRTLQRDDADGSTFGMVGAIRYPKNGMQVPLKNGVEIQISGKPEVGPNGLRVELRGVRRFRIEGEVDTSEEGWTEARVSFLDSAEEEEKEEKGDEPLSLARAISKAKRFTRPDVDAGEDKSLVDRWIELARENERQEGQIKKLLEDLGEIPDSTQPTERALWMGALINPLPGMGVAMEIRPALLVAKTAEERVQIALDGIKASIRHMDGTKRMW